MRQHLKRLLAGIAPHVPDRVVRGLFGQFCPIFMLHRVSAQDDAHSHSVAQIEACLRYLRQHRFRPLSLADLGERLARGERIPDRSVVFTIDDGFTDQFEYAGPLFSRFEAPLTCFVITGFLDGHLWPWDDQLQRIFQKTAKPAFTVTLPGGETRTFDLTREAAHRVGSVLREALKALPNDDLYDWLKTLHEAADVEQTLTPPDGMKPMSWAEARRFVAMGHSIAPHTVSHRILSQLSDEESERELSVSLRRVHEETGRAPTVFAYPTGRLQDFSAREVKQLAGSGIRCAVSTDPRAALPKDHLHALPRFSMPRTVEDFAQYLSFIEVAKERFRGRAHGRHAGF